jgi:hypothetical protein
VLLLRQRAVSGDAPRNRRQRRVGVRANRGKADRAFRHGTPMLSVWNVDVKFDVVALDWFRAGLQNDH